jgi:hypothetical protein
MPHLAGTAEEIAALGDYLATMNAPRETKTAARK